MDTNLIHRFIRYFDSYPDVKYDTVSQPRFNQMISSGMTDNYTALVFYDMWQEITEDQRKSFLELLKKGQGMVFLHHALVAYQHWDEFINIIGGNISKQIFMMIQI